MKKTIFIAMLLFPYITNACGNGDGGEMLYLPLGILLILGVIFFVMCYGIIKIFKLGKIGKRICYGIYILFMLWVLYSIYSWLGSLLC